MRMSRRMGLCIKKVSTPPTYIGKTGYIGSSYGITVPVPTDYQSGDLLLLLLEGRSAFPTVPNGWTEICGQVNNASTAWLKLCYKIASSNESSAAVADSGDSTRGVMLCFRGVNTNSPINSYGGTNRTGISLSISGITTTNDNCMIVIAIGFYDGDSDDTSNYSSWANSSLVSITEEIDQSDSLGAGGGLALAYGIKPLAGATGTTTVTTDSSSNDSGIIIIAIEPL